MATTRERREMEKQLRLVLRRRAGLKARDVGPRRCGLKGQRTDAGRAAARPVDVVAQPSGGLASRRPARLAAWRRGVDGDPSCLVFRT